jgi:hypothetical protein
MKHPRTFGLCLLYLASFLAPQACLNNPESTVETQEFPLEIAGRTEDPSGAPLAEVMVYVEQESAPEGVSDAEGRFSFSWDEQRLETLRLRYNPGRLRLYFVKGGTTGFGAVYDRINPIQIGTLDMGVIRLQPDLTMSGFVFATRPLETAPTPVVGAKVRVGRQEVLTDASGRYSTRAPSEQVLPVVIEKAGYVQTRSTWEVRSAPESRNFTLYDRLSVSGMAATPVLPRSAEAAPASIPLIFNTNALVAWVRVSADFEALERDPGSVNQPWRSIEDSIRVPRPSSGSVVYYYQFADTSRSIRSDIFSILVEADPAAPDLERPAAP